MDAKSMPLHIKLACSASGFGGGFGGFHLSSRHFGLVADWENWGENAMRNFFLPPTGLVNFLPRPNSPLFS